MASTDVDVDAMEDSWECVKQKNNFYEVEEKKLYCSFLYIL